MLSGKIRTHALKRSRKCAALAAELLEAITLPEEAPPAVGGDGGAAGEELRTLREEHTSLLEEATFWKMQAQGLERENRRLTAMTRGIKASKKELLKQIGDLEAAIQKERNERAAMEVALSEAYSQTLRELVAVHDGAAAQKPTNPPASAAQHGVGRAALPLHKMKGLFR